MRRWDPIKLVCHGTDPIPGEEILFGLFPGVLAHFKEISLSLTRSRSSLCTAVKEAVDFRFFMVSLLIYLSNKSDNTAFNYSHYVCIRQKKI